MRVILNRTMQKMRNRQMSAAFDAWVQLCEDNHLDKKLTSKEDMQVCSMPPCMSMWFRIVCTQHREQCTKMPMRYSHAAKLSSLHQLHWLLSSHVTEMHQDLTPTMQITCTFSIHSIHNYPSLLCFCRHTFMNCKQRMSDCAATTNDLSGS